MTTRKLRKAIAGSSIAASLLFAAPASASAQSMQPTQYMEPSYLVHCVDGTISYAGGHQGACSWHGGVAY